MKHICLILAFVMFGAVTGYCSADVYADGKRTIGSFVITGDIDMNGFSVTDIDSITGDGSGSITNFLNIWAATDFYEGGVALSSKYASITDTLTGAIADYQWTTGNVWYVAAGSSIETAHDNAAAGDTLVLAAGTYTVTDDIDITKAIAIVGQGVGKTIIQTTTDSKNVFEVTANSVLIRDLSISVTANGTRAIYINGTAGDVLSGIVIEDCDIVLNSHIGEQTAVHVSDASSVIRDLKIRATSTGTGACGILFTTYSSAEAATTCVGYGLDIVAQGNDDTVSGISIYDYLSTSDATFSLYHSTVRAIESSFSVGYGVWVRNGDAIFNAEFCNFNGSDVDVVDASSGGVILRSCVLINNTTSGTITYDGTLASEVFSENGTVLASKYLGILATAADSDKLGGVAAASWATDAELDAKTLTNSFTWADNSQSAVTNSGPRLNETNDILRISYWCASGSAVVSFYSGLWSDTTPASVLANLEVTTARQETNVSIGIAKDWCLSYWPTNTAWTNLYIDVMMERQD